MPANLITRIIVAISVILYGSELGCPSHSPDIVTRPTSPYFNKDTCPPLLPIQFHSFCPASSVFALALEQQVAVFEPQQHRDDVCPFTWPIERVPVAMAVTTLNDLAAALGQHGPTSCESQSGLRGGVETVVTFRVFNHDYSIQSHAHHLPSSSRDFWVQRSTCVFLLIIAVQLLINIRFYRLACDRKQAAVRKGSTILALLSHILQDAKTIASKDASISNLRNQLAQKATDYGILVISKYVALRRINQEFEWSELAYKTDRTCMQNIINGHQDEATTLQTTLRHMVNLVLELRQSLRNQRGITAKMVEEKKRADRGHQATFNEMLDTQLENQVLQDRICQLEDALSGPIDEDHAGEQIQVSGTLGLFSTSWDSEEPSMTSDSSGYSSESDSSIFSSPTVPSPEPSTERSWLKPEWAEASIKFRGVKRRPRLPPHMMKPTPAP